MKTVLIYTIPLLSALFFLCSGENTMMPPQENKTMRTNPVLSDTLMTATFAGGCFWCMEPPFEKIDGVIAAVAGYTGGTTSNPTYARVSSGQTNHVEAVEVTYDPRRVSYLELLNVFWRSFDPTDTLGQFVDRGKQYRPALFYHSSLQRAQALASLQSLSESGLFTTPVITKVIPATAFFRAEEYHQDYYKKNSEHYHRYRAGSGRDQFLQKVWQGATWSCAALEVTRFSKPDEAGLNVILTELQYDVTQQSETERAFNNLYWDNKAEGIYVDIVSGEPLFSSLDKYTSGTGWPSFVAPVDSNAVLGDEGLTGGNYAEVRSSIADSHLGHVFTDGPAPAYLRYCINSAALIFIPKEYLAREGYGRYFNLFP